jgi:hypothetical protein
VLANGSISRAGESSFLGAAKTAAADMAAAASQSTCSNALSKLTLTDSQKTKIAALQAQCPKGPWTKAVADKFMGGLGTILTTEQMATFKVAMATGITKWKALSATQEAAGAAPAAAAK